MSEIEQFVKYNGVLYKKLTAKDGSCCKCCFSAHDSACIDLRREHVCVDYDYFTFPFGEALQNSNNSSKN